MATSVRYTVNISEIEEEYPDPYTMTEDVLQARLNKKLKGRFITQFLAGLVASLGSILFGAVLGWSSPAFRTVKKYEASYVLYYSFSWIASLVPIGICIGTIFWSYFNQKIGPRKSMLLQSLLFCMTWVALGTNINRKLYMACRFFCGFLATSYIVCGETLLIESVHYGYLRIYMVCFRSFVFLGVMLINIGGRLIGEFYFSLLPPGIIILHFLLLFLLCPESPVHLFGKNEQEAIKAIKWYRGRVSITSEMRTIRKDAEYRKLDPEAHKYMLYSKVVVKGILIVLFLMFFQVFSGYYCFIFFNMMIWDQYGGDYFDEYSDTLIYGSCLFLSNLISTIVHFNVPFGVRKPMMISMSLVSVNLFLIVVYCTLWEYEVEFTLDLKFLPLIVVNTNVICYELGLSVLPDTIIFDYMPYQIFPLAKTIVKSVHWIFVFILIKIFLFISAKFSFAYSFFICLICSIVGIFYIRYFVVETKDRTLVQIQIDIGGNPVGNRGAYRRQKSKRAVLM